MTWSARRAGRRRWPEQLSMNVTNSPGRPPLSPQEGWLSDGRQVLHCADELATIGPVPVRV